MMGNRKRVAELQQSEQRLADRLSDKIANLPARVEAAVGGKRSRLKIATTVGWVAGAVVMLAAGVYAGKEVRSRYKFKRRTPYDYYGHAGDRRKRVDVEYPVGV